MACSEVVNFKRGFQIRISNVFICSVMGENSRENDVSKTLRKSAIQNEKKNVVLTFWRGKGNVESQCMINYFLMNFFKN